MPIAQLSGAFVVPASCDPATARWSRRPPRLARMDRLCALAIVAAEGAVADAGLDLTSIPSERIAVVVGTRFGCHATNDAYYRGLLAEGPRGVSPRLFAYTLPSSPLGELTIHLGAQGPAETDVSGRHAGLAALGRAARLCAEGFADVAIVVAVEAPGDTLAALGRGCADGAVAFVVESERRSSAASGRGLGQVLTSVSAFQPIAAASPRGGLADPCEEVVARALAPAVTLDGAPTVVARIPVAPGQGAVDAPAALAEWLRAPGDPLGCVAVADPAGGVTAVLVARG